MLLFFIGLLLGIATSIGVLTLLSANRQPDTCHFHPESTCCYPIEDCKNCPNHPGNEWMV